MVFLLTVLKGVMFLVVHCFPFSLLESQWASLTWDWNFWRTLQINMLQFQARGPVSYFQSQLSTSTNSM